MRRAYIEAQRRDHGRRAVAVLPVFYPKELLTAHNLLAVEMWGPPGAPRGVEAGRVQTYVCAVVRNALAFLASGKADAVDGVLFPHTCDSIQGLATLAPDFGGWNKAVFRYIHPRGDEKPSTRAFVKAELAHLSAALGELAGDPLDVDRLWSAIRLHRDIDALRAELLDRRAESPWDDATLYALLRRGEWMWPADHLAELRQARDRLAGKRVRAGVPLLVTGYVPEPMGLFDALEDAGAFVAADDYAAVGRRVVRLDAARLDRHDDPFEALADLHFAAPPCPTRTTLQGPRLDRLDSLARKAGAKGVLLHTVKFCEPELFDVPAVLARFRAAGLPTLHIESELETHLSGQTVTRLEAFVEMLAKGGRA